MGARRWADGPFGMVPIASTESKSPITLLIAQQMGGSHNNILRALNSAYNQAPYVKKEEDKRDLLQYMLFWLDWIDNHHRAEETLLFPAIGEATGGPNLMDVNIRQHEELQEGLDRLKEYVTACLDPPQREVTFDAEQYINLIDSFAYDFRQHLVDEIGTFTVIDVEDDEATEKALQQAYLEWDGKMREDTDKHTGLPMILGSSDIEFEGGENFWPQTPAWAKYIVHHVFERRHRNVWRFLPSDTWGRRRKLAFGPSGQ